MLKFGRYPPKKSGWCAKFAEEIMQHMKMDACLWTLPMVFNHFNHFLFFPSRTPKIPNQQKRSILIEHELKLKGFITVDRWYRKHAARAAKANNALNTNSGLIRDLMAVRREAGKFTLYTLTSQKHSTSYRAAYEWPSFNSMACQAPSYSCS